MPPVPTWFDFWQWFMNGLFVVPLLELLKKLPEPLGSFFSNWAFLWAPILSALAPIIGQVVLQRWPSVDAWLWTFIYALVAYAVSQLTYWLGKQTGRIVKTA